MDRFSPPQRACDTARRHAPTKPHDAYGDMIQSSVHALARLERLRLQSGSAVAVERLRLLRRLERARLRTAAQVRRLHELLCFARGYPDNSLVLRQAVRMLRRFEHRGDLRSHHDELYSSGIAGTTLWFPFFYPTARWLAARWPDQLRLDRSDTVAEESITKMLPALVTPLEAYALRESHLPGYAALDHLRGKRTDATFLVERVAAMPGNDRTREAFYDAINPSCELMPGGTTPSRTLAHFSGAERTYRTRPLRSDRPDLREEIGREPRRVRQVTRSVARELIDLARASMATRERDLDAFAYGNAADTWWIDDDDGLAFALIGTAPERRIALPAIYGGLSLHNGVPIGYHQSDMIGSTAAVSFNTFETFRGAESAHVFARLLATLRALFSCTSFSIEPYQLGDGNDEGIASGAWWFYYKLGFRPRARAAKLRVAAETARLRKDPGRRTSEDVLRALAGHHVFFDLDPAKPGPLVLVAKLGLAVGSFLGELHADRAQALRLASAKAHAVCGMPNLDQLTGLQRHAWDMLCPLYALLDVRRWTRTERAQLMELVHAKAAASEREAVRVMATHPRLLQSLKRIADRSAIRRKAAT